MFAKDFQNAVGVGISLKYCLVCLSPIEEYYDPTAVNVSSYLKGICVVVGLTDLETDVIIRKHENVIGKIYFCASCRHNLEMIREIGSQLECLNLQMSQIKNTVSHSLCSAVDVTFEGPTSPLRTILLHEYDSRNIPKIQLVNLETILAQDCIPINNPVGTIAVVDITSDENENSTTKIVNQWNLKDCQVKLERIEDVEDTGKIYFDDKERRNIRLQKIRERQTVKLLVTTTHHRQRKTKHIARPELAPFPEKIQSNARIKCPQCPQHRHTEEMLRFHFRRKHEDKNKKFNCYNCDVEYWLLKDLRYHEVETGHYTPNLHKENTNQGPQKSIAISDGMPTSQIKIPQFNQTNELLRIPGIQEDKKGTYNSFNCEEEFESLEKLRNHETETGNFTPSLPENLVKKKANRKPERSNKTYDNKTKFRSGLKCTKCQQHRRTEERLRFHNRRIHENKMAVYNCFNCEAEFVLLQHLRNHENETGHCTPSLMKLNSTKKVANQSLEKSTKTRGKRILALDFKCSQCQQHHHSEELLRFHVRRIHERKIGIYNCFNCDEEFDLLIKLRDHEAETGHHTSNLQRLPSAKKRTNPNLQNRKNVSAKKIKIIGNFKCTHCTKCLQTKELLRFHVRRNHEGKVPYNCVKCDEEFEAISKLRAHEAKTGHYTSGSNVEKVECKTCNREFLRQNYDAHLERQGGECKRILLLPSNGFYDKSQKKSQRYVCRECGRKYRSPHHLDIHVRGSHTDGFAFMCEYCSKPFSSKNSLNRHQQQNHLEEILVSTAQEDVDAMLSRVEKRTCKICQITFSSNEAKLSHDRRHTTDYKYQCEICGSGWTTLASLKCHSRTHTGKKYKCDICDHRFCEPQKRDIHMRSKHGIGDLEKKFRCHICEKKFWTMHKMQQHIKLMHSNYKKGQSTVPLEFGCDICDYTCAIREYQTIHSRTKKHLQNVKDRGLTDIKSGLRCLEPRYKTNK